MKLSQILGIEKTTRTDVAATLKEAIERLRRPELFSGFTRTYSSLEDGGEVLPQERKTVQARVADVLEQIRFACVDLWDVQATKDAANTLAKADVVVSGQIILRAVPATTLLQIEKNLTTLFEDLKAIPVLDPASEWSPDTSTGLFRTPPTEQVRTKKVPRIVTLAPATEQHPAQTQLLTEDVPVGRWSGVAHSGAMTAVERRAILVRISNLVKAVTAAREEANTQEATQRRVGDQIFDYLFTTK